MKADGTLLNFKQYAAFGETTLDTLGVTRQGYIGKEKDLENGLGDHGVRKYDPITGRFNSIDPFWELYIGLNPYQYAGNNPLMYSDGNGYGWIDEVKQAGKDVAAGAASAIYEDLTGNKAPGYSNSGSKYFQGAKFGVHVADAVVGGVVAVQGAIQAAAGATISTTGAGAVVGVPAMATGAAQVVGGAVIAGNATTNAVNMMSQGGSSQNKIEFTQGTGDKARKVSAEIPEGYTLDKSLSKENKGKVFKKNGANQWISPDLDGHNGGMWKSWTNKKDVGKVSNRSTLNSNLEKIGD